MIGNGRFHDRGARRAALALVLAAALASGAFAGEERRLAAGVRPTKEAETYATRRFAELADRVARRPSPKELARAGVDAGRDTLERAEKLGHVPPSVGTADPLAPGVAAELGLRRDPALELAVRDDLAGALRRKPTAKQLDKAIAQVDAEIAALNRRLRERLGEIRAAYAKEGRLPHELRAGLARSLAQAGAAPSPHDGAGDRSGGDRTLEASLYVEMLNAAARPRK